MSNVFHTISRLFHGVSHVESLETNLNFLSKCIEAGHDLVLPNLKTLELTTTNSDYTVTALIQVLKICPKLESLNLTIKKVSYVFTWEDSDESEDPKSDSDVKWVESFEFNGEKPKVDIDWYENKNDWRYITARWGNKAK
ncbi:hypothetical protein L1887_02589 [Cichorium endivia]|nr:hypothetical protein L1887_02589 [Cichorium endivia]